MSHCPTCGRTNNGSSKIVVFVLGIVGLVFLGLPVIAFVCLTAVATIGSEADAKFEEISRELEQPAAMSRTSDVQAEITEGFNDEQFN